MEDIKDLSRKRYLGAKMNIISSFVSEDDEIREMVPVIERFLKGLTANKIIKILKNITGDDSIKFEDLGKNIYISDHMWGSNKDIFKVLFQSDEGNKDIEITVATKREKVPGDITKNEIRDVKTLQKRPGHVVPRFGVETAWGGKKWYVEEFIEGDTIQELETAGKFTTAMRKKIVSCLLSISVGLGGMVPADINGGNFIITDDTNDAVMVDLGGRRFRVFRKASENIENEETEG